MKKPINKPANNTEPILSSGSLFQCDDVVEENYLQLDLSLELLFCRVFSNKVSKAISVQLRNFDSNNIGEISEPQNVTNTNTNNLYLFRCETG